MGEALRRLARLVFMTAVLAGGAGVAWAEDVTYEKDVRKIISERCLSCHGSSAPTMEAFKKDEDGYKKAMKGPRLDSYANLMVVVNGSDTGAFMRRLDDGKSKDDRKPGNMYQFLGGKDEDRAANLEIMKKWVGGWTLKRKKDITADELKAIRALEK